MVALFPNGDALKLQPATASCTSLQ